MIPRSLLTVAIALLALALSVVLFRGRSDADVASESNDDEMMAPSNGSELNFENAMKFYHSAFTRESAKDLSEALEDLADFSLSYDAADMMASAGVYDFLTEHLNQCLKAELAPSCCSPRIKSQIAITLGSAAQNHVAVSKRLTEAGAVSALIKLAEYPSHDCVHRSLFALSSIFRAYSPAGLAFANDLNGFGVLKPILSAHPQRTLRIVETLSTMDIDIPEDWCSDIADILTSCSDDIRSDAISVAVLLSSKNCSSHFSHLPGSQESLLKQLPKDETTRVSLSI